jgi:hypothetical protein
MSLTSLFSLAELMLVVIDISYKIWISCPVKRAMTSRRFIRFIRS